MRLLLLTVFIPVNADRPTAVAASPRPRNLAPSKNSSAGVAVVRVSDSTGIAAWPYGSRVDELFPPTISSFALSEFTKPVTDPSSDWMVGNT